MSWAIMSGVPAQRVALAGAADQGDVWLWPRGGGARVVVEVKDRPSGYAHFPSGLQLAKWYSEATAAAERVLHADMSVLVVKPKGVGYSRAGEWWAWVSPDDLHTWQRAATWPTAPPVPVMLPLGSLLSWLLKSHRAPGSLG